MVFTWPGLTRLTVPALLKGLTRLYIDQQYVVQTDYMLAGLARVSSPPSQPSFGKGVDPSKRVDSLTYLYLISHVNTWPGLGAGYAS